VPASRVSFINYKGGVGKTTLAVEIATAVAAWVRKPRPVRVLLCDLDPQSNASLYLMGADKWDRWVNDHGSVLDLFEKRLGQEGDVDLCPLIYPWRDDYGRVRIDLLPSHPRLMLIEARLAARFGPDNMQAALILDKAIKQVVQKEAYELVIFDCPPNLGFVTQNALAASSSYVIIAMPEFLSTLGIETLLGFVEEYNRKWKEHAQQLGGDFTGPELKGIIFNRVRYLTGGTRSQEAIMERVRQGKLGHYVFKSVISETDRFPQRAELNAPIVLSPYARDESYKEQVEEVAWEFIEKVI